MLIKTLMLAGILLAGALVFGSEMRTKPHGKVISLNPYSKTLSMDINECEKNRCEALYATSIDNITRKDTNPFTLHLAVERCTIKLESLKTNIIENGKRMHVMIDETKGAIVKCPNSVNTYKRANAVSLNGQLGFYLNETENGFTHRGKMNLGVLFLKI